MCEHPITIRNRTRRFEFGVTKPFIQVPCGHCKECVKGKQDEWFVRSVFEFRRVTDSGGAVWFPTLTYDNEHLPWYHDDERDYHVPCFRKSDFVSFRNKLRVNLKRAGYNVAGKNTIRYIYCCEYGGRKKRPHIHSLLFVPLNIPASVMYDCIKRSWCNGMVMYSKKGMIADSIKAAQYTMKYISKDFGYEDRFHSAEYLARLSDEFEHEEDELKAEKIHDTIKEFRRCLPHHCQSMGFGIQAVSYLTDLMLVEDCITSKELGLIPSKEGAFQWNFRVPGYYKRKMMYDYDKYNNLYRINDYGLSIMEQSHQRKIDAMVETYKPFFAHWNDFFDQFKPLQYTKLSDRDFVQDKKFFESFCGKKRNLRDFVIYNLFYRGVPLTKRLYFDYNYFPADKVLRYLDDTSLAFSVAQKQGSDIVTEEGFNKKPLPYFQYTYDNLICFRKFRLAAELIDYYQRILGREKVIAFTNEQVRLSKVYVDYDNFYVKY